MFQAYGSSQKSKQANESKSKKRRNGNGGGGGNSGDTQFKEFYLNEKFESVTQALTIFKDDELLSKPGEWLLLDWKARNLADAC